MFKILTYSESSLYLLNFNHILITSYVYKLSQLPCKVGIYLYLHFRDEKTVNWTILSKVTQL